MAASGKRRIRAVLDSGNGARRGDVSDLRPWAKAAGTGPISLVSSDC